MSEPDLEAVREFGLRMDSILGILTSIFPEHEDLTLQQVRILMRGLTMSASHPQDPVTSTDISESIGGYHSVVSRTVKVFRANGRGDNRMGADFVHLEQMMKDRRKSRILLSRVGLAKLKTGHQLFISSLESKRPQLLPFNYRKTRRALIPRKGRCEPR